MICRNINYEQLDGFVCAHPMANHIKTTAYGRVEKKNNESILSLGFFEEDLLVATAMILVHRNFFGTHWYIPGGLCVDMFNLNLSHQVHEELKRKAIEANILYLRLELDVQRRKHHQDGQVDEQGFNNHYITETLQSWGFTHLGYKYGYSGNIQSRYTQILSLSKDVDDLIADMHSTIRSYNRKNNRRGVFTVVEGKDKLHYLHEFAKELALKQHFIPKSLKEFEEIYETYREFGHYFVSYVDLEKALSNIKSELFEAEQHLVSIDRTHKRSKGAIKEVERLIENLKQEIPIYSDYQKKHGNLVAIGAAFFVSCGQTSYDLYTYTTKTISSLRPAIDLHLEAIRCFRAKGIKNYDFVGISGETDPSDPFFGLYDFKRRFGGEFIEYLGEFDYIFKPKQRQLSLQSHALRRRIERKLIREYYQRVKRSSHD